MISKDKILKAGLQYMLATASFFMFWVIFPIVDSGRAGEKASYIKQNHRIHVQQEEIDCADCHAGEGEARLPKKEICADCHEQVEETDNKNGCLFCHDVALEKIVDIENRALKVVQGSDSYENIRFSHKNHEEKNAKCSECHGEIGKESAIPFPRGKHMPAADQCLDCHAKNIEGFDPSGQCGSCHPSDLKHIAPFSHKAGWNRRHGLFAETNIDKSHGTDCMSCHSKNSCVDCHSSELPKDHTNFWRTRGHGIMAAVDRDRCLNCHRQDSCVACHDETAPRSHMMNWDKNHCQSCHMEEGCGVCHKPPDHSGVK